MSESENVWDRLNREKCEQLGLLACPFCGGFPRLRMSGGTFYVTCNDCNTLSGAHAGESAVAAAWNQRKQDAASEREAELHGFEAACDYLASPVGMWRQDTARILRIELARRRAEVEKRNGE